MSNADSVDADAAEQPADAQAPEAAQPVTAPQPAVRAGRLAAQLPEWSLEPPRTLLARPHSS